MSPERINKLNIDNQPLFTGIYGLGSLTDEYYIEDNLCVYNFRQELYRYLRQNGHITLFYSQNYGFFSYEESQLETFFFSSPEKIHLMLTGESVNKQQVSTNRPARFVAPIASPNAKNRRRGIRLSPVPSQEPETAPLQSPGDNNSDGFVSHRPSSIIATTIQSDRFFQLKDSAPAIKHLFELIDINSELNPDLKVTVVFLSPQDISFSPFVEPAWKSLIATRSNDFAHARTKARIIVAYDYINADSLVNEGFGSLRQRFFFQEWFLNQMFPNQTSEGRKDINKPTRSAYYIDTIGRDEVGYALQRRRIMEGLQYTISPINFDDVTLRLWQEFSVSDPKNGAVKESINLVKQYLDDQYLLPKDVFESVLQKMDNDKAIDKLRKMWGMEGIIEQFEAYMNDLRACRASGERFRRHLVFMGNPGTGKTTVAKLFADVLREEGLLENGRLHQVTVGDLVSEYVGGTRPKTQEVCKRAHGGVLFIDEAYGLYQKGSADGSDGVAGGSNNSGKEAVEVLLQFMENDNQSLVIMAGYPDEMNDMLTNSNPGLNSRINSNGHILFEDYSPEILTKIALSQAKLLEHTDEFEKSLKKIFTVKSRFKDKDWANARTAENIMSSIMSQHRKIGKGGPLDVNSIPEDLMKLIHIPTPEEDRKILAELNEMVGLKKVKTGLTEIFDEAKMQRIRSEFELDSGKDSPMRLNFIFSGNPGTGKTTVARLMGKILHSYGLLLSPEVKEYSKGQIVSQMRGGTIKNVIKMFDDCIGRVMFIDEAYMLDEPDAKEALDQIVQCITSPKYEGKMAIILAGYPEKMKKLKSANAGISRRFTRNFEFEDYSNDELYEIFLRFAVSKKMTVADGCEPLVKAWIKAQKRDENFANADLIIKNLWPSIEKLIVKRISKFEIKQINPTELNTILPEDIPATKTIASASEKEIMAELNSMVGLQSVKDEIRKLINKVKLDKLREKKGITKNIEKPRLNFTFVGNPGTGKTTVARLMGKILAYYELIDDPEVISCGKSDFIDGTAGGGSRNVDKFFKLAKGKVLFIDEAYKLADGSPQGNEVLDQITECLTSEEYANKMAVILAGYPGNMAKLIAMNPGLKSRFNYKIIFQDYSPDELCEILRIQAETQGNIFAEGWYPYAKGYFSTLPIGSEGFGNGREAENLLQDIKTRRDDRLSSDGQDITPEMLMTIIPEDFPNYGKLNTDKYQPAKDGAKLSGWEKLDKMRGIDSIRKHFRDYFNMLRYVRDNPQEEIHFRPHMAFMGNPGTGKTTVARIFSEILLQEGLIPNSNFVVVSPTDLIGEYLGQSGPKARGQFERARGGILFIDEAYQLLTEDQTHGGGQYGKEVVTELIQFMENDLTSIVILAGYTKQTTWLIEKGNPGLKSRIPQDNYFTFEDYDADTLYQIFDNMLKREKTDIFQQTMHEIFENVLTTRSDTWGNAREAENYANSIFKRYLAKGEQGPIDIDCIPDSLLKFIANSPINGSNQPIKGQPVNKDNSDSPVRSKEIVLNLSANDPEKRAMSVKELEKATGLVETEDGEGTGFIIQLNDSYILTCSHVIEGCSNITFATSANQTPSPAHVIWHDPKIDMAILKVDSLPAEACYLPIDTNFNEEPEMLTELILCGYPDGSGFASGVSYLKGSVNNFERKHHWNDREFDTIYANISATHGCSGGPVLRQSDMMVIGLLQGGREGGEIQLITDVHQLFDRITIQIPEPKE